jgi:CheY-like chemotaxis protein
MQMHSRVDRGSVFKLSVEVAASAPPAIEPPAETSQAAQLPLFILVVDDEVAIQEAMHTLLTGWGHKVITAGSCAEMLGHAAGFTSTPNLIISDYRLRGDEEGIATIERLRSEFNSDIPAILITGDTAPDRIRQATASDCFLLHKPVSNSRLRAAIVNLAIAAPGLL